MKKLIVLLMFLVGTAVTFAQMDPIDDTQEQYLDQLEQLQETPTQLELEYRSQIDAERTAAEKEAKKLEKQRKKEKRKEEARKQKEVSN